MHNLFKDINSGGAKLGLKHTITKDSTQLDPKSYKDRAIAAEKIRDVTGIKSEEERRKYFFGSGIDAWYQDLKDYTFPTTIIEMSRNEGQAIINLFRNKEVSSSLEMLKPLETKLHTVIKEEHNSSAFIKLSTRSPKDSKNAFQKACSSYRAIDKTSFDFNQRWISFSEQLRQGFRVKKGDEAMALLTSSERVVEDLEFALKGVEDPLIVSLVVRTFDDAVLPETEFRGFVWNSKLTCISQSFYKLYFESLQGRQKKIEDDLLKFFETVDKNMRSPCYVVDLVWFSNGRDPLLIEVNPFDGEGLGTFPCSTGLFNWEKDRDVMTGKKPFELRMITEKPSESDVQGVNPEWSKVVLGD